MATTMSNMKNYNKFTCFVEQIVTICQNGVNSTRLSALLVNLAQITHNLNKYFPTLDVVRGHGAG